MIIISLFYLLLAFAIIWEIHRRSIADLEARVAAAQGRYAQDRERKAQILQEKKKLENVAAEIFTLYDMTQEISKHLTEQEAFKIFKAGLRESFYYEECLLLEPLAPEAKEIKSAEGWMLFPLRAKKEHLGYLAVKGVPDKDREKFTILVNQFALGLQRIRLYEEVEQLAMTDSLTQIYTRRNIMQRFEEEKRRAESRKTPLAFLMIDVDHFKKINDTHGHLVGDQVLREVARLIRDHTREIDICGRYGGEEFCALLPDTGEEGALQVAERIRSAVEQTHITAYDAKIHVTVSIGVSIFPRDGTLPADILDKADLALYRAKKNGRNRIHSASSLKESS